MRWTIGVFAHALILLIASTSFLSEAEACDRLARNQAFASQMLAPQERRVAFVSAVSAYARLAVARQSVRDGRAMAARLRQVGFDVILSADADAAGLQSCFATYLDAAERSRVQVFYFSGHGVQIGSGNYIAAKDASVAQGRGQGFIPLAYFIDAMAPRGGARLVILDASRSHGLAGQAIALGSAGPEPVNVGLSPEEMRSQTATSGSGQLVAFSANPNTETGAENGALSVFTDALVDNLGAPGFSIQRTLAEAARAVGERTNYERAPWTRSSLTADLFLNGRLDMASLRAASEAFAGQSERLLTSDRDRALAEALKGLPLAAPSDEPAFAAARRAYQKAARTVVARLPISRRTDDTQALVSADGQRIAVLQGLSFSLWDARGPRRVSGLELASDNAVMGSQGRTSSSPVMAFSPDGRHVAVFNPGPRQIASFDASTGASAARFSVTAERAPMGLALANGGRRMLAYHMDRSAVLDASGQTLLEVRSPRIGSADVIALSPDGREAAFLDEPRPRAEGPRVFAQVDAHTVTSVARPMAWHRYDLGAGRLIWSSEPTPMRSADYFHVSYAPRDDYVLFATPSGAFPNHSVTVLARATNGEVARGGPFASEIDSISYDGAYATERDTIYAFPALTRVDGRALATPPVIHRVFGNDDADLGGRIFAWPSPAPQSSAALEAARAALAPALASAVAEQRLAYMPLPAPQK